MIDMRIVILIQRTIPSRLKVQLRLTWGPEHNLNCLDLPDASTYP